MLLHAQGLGCWQTRPEGERAHHMPHAPTCRTGPTAHCRGVALPGHEGQQCCTLTYSLRVERWPYNKGELCSRWHWWCFVQVPTVTFLSGADAITAKLGKRGWRNGALPQAQLIRAIIVQHLRLLVLVIFLSDYYFFVVVPGLCVPHLHLSGLRDTIAICLYFSNPPCLDTTVWRLLGTCNSGCQFHYLSPLQTSILLIALLFAWGELLAF